MDKTAKLRWQLYRLILVIELFSHTLNKTTSTMKAFGKAFEAIKDKDNA